MQATLLASVQSATKGAGGQSQDALMNYPAKEVSASGSSEHSDKDPGIQAAPLPSIKSTSAGPPGTLQGLVATASAGSAKCDGPSTQHNAVPVLGSDQPSHAYKIGLLTFEDIVAHYNLAKLSKKECTAHIKSFLELNRGVLETYRFTYKTCLDSDGKTRTYRGLDLPFRVENTKGRIELSGAVKWLYALLRTVDKEIEREDKASLVPNMLELAKEKKKLEAANASELEWEEYHRHEEAIKEQQPVPHLSFGGDWSFDCDVR